MVKILPEAERIARYTKAYMTGRNCLEQQAYRKQHLRADQWACLGYAWGAETYDTVCQALKADPNDARWTYPWKSPLIFGSRVPSLVVDIGAGRCELACAFQFLTTGCIAIEPSPDAPELLAHTVEQWHLPNVALMNISMLEGLRSIQAMGANPDTIIFCESIEHITKSEFWSGWPLVVDLLTSTHGLCIIANWIDNHPIGIDRTGFDHISRIDDDLYDQLAETAEEVVFRQGSHLVLRF